MSKFPLLNTYRTLAIILAVLILIAGALAALSAATSFGRAFDIGAFLATAIPFLVVAFGLGVVAELIQLALSIENHLDRIRHSTEWQAARIARLDEANTSTTTPSLGSSQKPEYSPPAGPSSTQIPEKSIRIQAKVSTSIRTTPEAEAQSSGQLNSGQTMTAYGHNRDSTWLSISRAGKLWIDATDLVVVAGNVYDLPIMQATE